MVYVDEIPGPNRIGVIWSQTDCRSNLSHQPCLGLTYFVIQFWHLYFNLLSLEEMILCLFSNRWYQIELSRHGVCLLQITKNTTQCRWKTNSWCVESYTECDNVSIIISQQEESLHQDALCEKWINQTNQGSLTNTSFKKSSPKVSLPRTCGI